MFTHAAQRTGLTQRQLYGHCRHSTTNPIYAMVSWMLGATVSVRSVHALHCPAASTTVRPSARTIAVRYTGWTKNRKGNSPPHRRASDYIYHHPQFLDPFHPFPHSSSFQTRPEEVRAPITYLSKAPRHSRELFDRWARKPPSLKARTSYLLGPGLQRLLNSVSERPSSVPVLSLSLVYRIVTVSFSRSI